MNELEPIESPRGFLIENLLHFCRLLRLLNLKISIDQVKDLSRALLLIDIKNRDDFYFTARGMLLSDPTEFERFDRAFNLFWLKGNSWTVTFDKTLNSVKREDPELSPGSREQSLMKSMEKGDDYLDLLDDEESQSEDKKQIQPVYSPVELLRRKNFADYTEDEKEILKRAIRALIWEFDSRITRRLRRAEKREKYLDLRRSIRVNIGYSGEIIYLKWRRRKLKPRPLVVICDISGSMDRHTRIFLQFIHALSHGIRRVEAFAFGTRLTRLTPALRYEDVDTAVDNISNLVVDWSGGTRIGESFKTFNYQWSRRVLGWGAVVLIISDGWERGDLELLRRETARLRSSVHRILWLNPLAGSPGYEPLVQGIQTVLPYCDEFLPFHNFQSLEQVVSKLGSGPRLSLGGVAI